MVLTLLIFAATLLLIFLRPRGLNEAWAACIGGGLMLLFGRETPGQAWGAVRGGVDVLLFLFALMLLSALLERSGFFAWAAIFAARKSGGDGHRLYRNVFLLGAAATFLLSLDTTAIILTPIVLGFVQRLKLKARPFLLACAFVANTGSLLLPVSNLTNLLFQSAYHFSFGAFVLRMALPQAAVLGLNYALFRAVFQRDIPACFELATLPKPGDVIPDPAYFRAALWTIGGVTAGYFAGSLLGIPPYAVAAAGAVALLACGLARRQAAIRPLLREVSWPLFPFVIGLFVLVRGIENLGVERYAQQGLATLQTLPALAQAAAVAVAAGLGSNVVNNIPMALLAISLLPAKHSPVLFQDAALIGCNIGPNLTITGSLATMLVISSARKKGESVGAADFFKLGVWVTPLLLLAGAAALAIAAILRGASSP